MFQAAGHTKNSVESALLDGERSFKAHGAAQRQDHD
jgi:hypothetical protein